MNLIVKICLFLIIVSCNRDYRISNHESQLIEIKSSIDTNILKIINPYKISLEEEMNTILSYSKSELKKGQPESKLGNFVCDLSMKKANGQADFCILNNGGLRNIIPEGDVRVKDIFQVMPFENELVIIELDKTEFYELLSYVVNRGGEPIGGTQIIQKEDTIISNLNNKNNIRVLTTDYLANGGDNMYFLKGKYQKKLGIKMRDAIIEYCRNSDTINASLDNRLILWNVK